MADWLLLQNDGRNGKYFSQELRDSLYQLPKKDKGELAEEAASFKNAHIASTYEQRARMDEAWDFDIAAYQILIDLLGLRPHETWHPGDPARAIPPCKYNWKTGIWYVNELCKTGARRVKAPNNAHLLLLVLNKQGRFILPKFMPLSKGMKKEEKKDVLAHNKRILTKWMSSIKRFHNRVWYKNAVTTRRLARLENEIKAAREAAATDSERDEAEAQVRGDFEKRFGKIHFNIDRAPDGTLIRVPFGEYVIKTGRHTTGFMRYVSACEDAGAAAGYLGHQVSMFFWHYHGKEYTAIWGGLGSTENLDEVWRFGTDYYGQIPRQVRALGFRERDVPEMVKSGTHIVNGIEVDRYVRSGDLLAEGIEKPKWFTLESGKDNRVIAMLEARSDEIVAKLAEKSEEVASARSSALKYYYKKKALKKAARLGAETPAAEAVEAEEIEAALG